MQICIERLQFYVTFKHLPRDGSYRAAEGSPPIFLSPFEWFAGIPGGAVCRSLSQIPANVLGIIVIVSCPHIGRLLSLTRAHNLQCHNDHYHNSWNLHSRTQTERYQWFFYETERRGRTEWKRVFITSRRQLLNAIRDVLKQVS